MFVFLEASDYFTTVGSAATAIMAIFALVAYLMGKVKLWISEQFDRHTAPLNAKLDSNNTKIDGVNSRLDTLNGRVGKNEGRIAELEKRL